MDPFDSEADYDDSPAGVETDPDNPTIQDDDVVEELDATREGGEWHSTEGNASPAREVEFASVPSRFSQLLEWKQFTGLRIRVTGGPR